MTDKDLRDRLAMRLYHGQDTDIGQLRQHEPMSVTDCLDVVDILDAERAAAGYAVVREEPDDAIMLAAIEAFDREYGNHAWASESSLRAILKAALAATKEGS